MFKYQIRTTLALCLMLVAVLLMSTSAHAGLSDGLMAHYKFDGNANDSSGNGRNATAYNNFEYVDGVFSDGIHLVGSGHTGLGGGHVLMPFIPLNEHPEFTLSLWVNLQGHTSTHGERFISFGGSTDPHGGGDWVSIGYSGFPNGNLDFAVGGSSGGREAGRVSQPYPSGFVGSWNHLVLHADNGILTGYVNGQNIGSDPYELGNMPQKAGLGVSWFNSGGTESNRFIGSIDDVRIYDRALSASEVQSLYAPQAAPRSAPDAPAPRDSRYEFVLGGQAEFTWEPLELGMEFDLSVPGLEAISMSRKANFPENPISKQVGYEIGFGTNNWLIGETLSLATPTNINLASATGTAGIEGEAALMAGAYLTDGESHADFNIEAGLGIRAYAQMEVGGVLIDTLRALPVVGDYLDEVEFEIPIVGTPSVDVSASGISLPFTFDYLDFKDDIAILLGVDSSTLDDEGTETHLVGAFNTPITFIQSEQKVGFQIGAKARVYAETSISGSVDIYFREAGDTDVIQTIGDVFSDILDEPIDLTPSQLLTSDTGVVELSPEGSIQMTTGSPVWFMTSVECEDIVNLLAFDAEFLSEEGAEGLMAVYWDGELVATIDERVAENDLSSYIFALGDNFQAGTYELGFRVDSYTDVETVVNIDNLVLGYSEAIPEPASMTLLVLGGLAMLRRRRR